MAQAISHKHIWSLAWPMILSNLSVPLLGLIDTAILGHLSQPRYLAAVALGASMLTFIFWAFGFLRMGTTSFVAQAYGANDTQQYRQAVVQSLVIALLSGIILLLIHWPLINTILWFIQPGETLFTLAREYTQIRLFSAPAVMINYVVMGYFLGIQQTRTPLLIAIVINSINIALDYLFIVVLNENSRGAAWASVIADYSGLLLGLYFVHQKLPLKQLLNESWKNIDTHSLQRIITVNRHLFVRTASLLFVFLFIASQGAKQGEVILAANAILLQLLSVVSYGLDGFAHATETLVGHSAGKRSIQYFWATCRKTTYWSLWTALIMTALFALLKAPIIYWMTDIDAVAQYVHIYYNWLLLLPIVSVWAYQLDGVFIGLGESAILQHCMLISLLGVFLPLWYLSLPLANHGLWLSLIAFNGARGITLGWCLWKKENVFIKK